MSRKKYSFKNEGLCDDEYSPSFHPFSYLTLDNKLVRLQSYQDFLIHIGEMKNKRVIEMGCGMGILATFLESIGCDYYALEASKNFAKITKKIIFSEKVKRHILNKSFYSISCFNLLFDIVIFESSFHHCGEPVKLLKLIYKYTAKDAKIIFLKESIEDWYDRPWGIVRPDGETILQIRLRGWLELGYRKDFFKELLTMTGWKIENTFQFDNVDAYIATKKEMPYINLNKNYILVSEIIIQKNMDELKIMNDIIYLEMINGNIVLKCGTYDPQYYLPLQVPIEKPKGNQFIEILCSNDRAGKLQIYYDYNNGLSEQNSFSGVISSRNREEKIQFPIIGWSEGMRLIGVRIDPPDGTKFTLIHAKILTTPVVKKRHN